MRTCSTPASCATICFTAADQEIIAIAWSAHILDEVTEHLMEQVAGFDHAAAQRLVSAMNRAFPHAEVEPDTQHWRMLDEVSLPDGDDRHVLAAALAAEATVLCTANTKDFPTGLVEALGVEVLTPDQLLSRLLAEYEPQMLAVHRTTVTSRQQDRLQRSHSGMGDSFEDPQQDRLQHRLIGMGGRM